MIDGTFLLGQQVQNFNPRRIGQRFKNQRRVQHGFLRQKTVFAAVHENSSFPSLRPFY
jgi:hypothetical protein